MGMLNVPELCMSWPSTSRSWTCRRSCGKRTSTLRRSRRRRTRPGSCIADSWTERNMSKCGFPTLSLSSRLSMRIEFNRLATFMSKRTRSCAGLVKKRRKVQGEDGSDHGWEEYFDYIFPEDEAAKP